MNKEHKDYYLTLDTIEQGHFDNLVMQDDITRIWVSRVETSTDDLPLVTVENLVDGKWLVTSTI